MKHPDQEFRSVRVVVTGGAGFIGSHLVERLVSCGAYVTAVDNLSRGSLANLSSVLGRIVFRKADLRSEKQAAEAIRNHEVLFNLAAVNTGIDYDIRRTQYMFEENMLLQMIPLRVAYTAGVRRFIQVSSASVYNRRSMELHIPTKETDDCYDPEPSKLGYALAKQMGERLAQWYDSSNALESKIVRFINVYGPRDNVDETSHFIPSIVRKFKTAQTEISVFGSGRQKRSFMHVDDAVSGLLMVAAVGQIGEVYNIDPQDEHEIRQVVQMIKAAMGKEQIRIRYDRDMPEGSKRRLLDNTKIRQIGWVPTRSLTESIAETVRELSSRCR